MTIANDRQGVIPDEMTSQMVGDEGAIARSRPITPPRR